MYFPDDIFSKEKEDFIVPDTCNKIYTQQQYFQNRIKVFLILYRQYQYLVHF